MNKTKKILLVIGLIVVLGGVAAFIFRFSSKNEIILKMPPGYSDRRVKVGEEFVIESATLGGSYGSQVGDIQLKLKYIKDNSIVADILADRRADGGFRPRDQIVQTEILNGSCIWAYPLVTDSSYEYCFDLAKENGKITLKYQLQGQSTMPTP